MNDMTNYQASRAVDLSETRGILITHTWPQQLWLRKLVSENKFKAKTLTKWYMAIQKTGKRGKRAHCTHVDFDRSHRGFVCHVRDSV
jgi:hypothetical protein